MQPSHLNAFTQLMDLRGSDRDLGPGIRINGSDPFFRTPFKLGETVACVLAAMGVAVNDI